MLLLVTLALAGGCLMAFTNPAAAAKAATTTVSAQNCQSSVTDTPTGLTVKACSYSETHKSASITSATRAQVKGKTQLSYQRPGTVAWSKSKALRCQAIFIPKSWYKGSQSKVRQHVRSFALRHLSTVGGQKCVRLKHNSWWFDSGMRGKFKKPVLQRVHGQWSLMVQNAHTGVLEHDGEMRAHGFWLVCGNDWIWVALHAIPETKVLWVRSENDVLKNVNVHGESGGSLALSGTKACPGGDITWSINQSTSDTADVHDQLTQRVIAAASGSAYASAMARAVNKAEANAVSKVVTSLNITCGSTTPPASPPSVTSLFQPQNVKVNQPFTNCYNSVLVPAGDPFTVVVTSDIGVVTNVSAAASTGSDSPIAVCYTYTAPGETGTDAITLMVKDNTTGLSASKTTAPFPVEQP